MWDGDEILQIGVLNVLKGESIMVCSSCKRRIADCDCQANNEMVKHWPKSTWFQKRLKKVLIAQTNGHEPERETFTRDAGFSVLEVMLFLTVFAAIMTALVTLASVSRQVIENFQSIDRCIQALLECVSI